MKKDIIIPAVLVILLALLTEPFGFMPPMAVMSVLALVVAVFAAFALFLWRERGADEREESHIHRADRIGFISGALVLVIAIVFEALNHMLSSWLVLALIVMILAKASALIYEKNRH